MRGGLFQASEGFGCMGCYGKAMGRREVAPGFRVSPSASLLLCGLGWEVREFHLPESLHVLAHRMGTVRTPSQDVLRHKADNGHNVAHGAQ